MYKSASETAKSALGELVLLKTAGRIDDYTFAGAAANIIKTAADAGATGAAGGKPGILSKLRGHIGGNRGIYGFLGGTGAGAGGLALAQYLLKRNSGGEADDAAVAELADALAAGQA